MGKVRAGQTFNPTARDWNRFVDVADAFDAGRFGVDSTRTGGTTVLAKNSTGGDVNQLGVMAINGLVFSATEAAEQFGVGAIVLDCDGPTASTDAGNFVIAAQPIADGEIGKVWSSGVAPVTLEIDQDWHRFVDVKSSVAELKTYPGGGAEILWQESGTGTGKKALVRFCASPFVVCEFSLSTAMATTDSSDTATITHCNIPGYATESITPYNHNESGGDYIFEGDSGDDGTAYYDAANDKWYIIQMECP